MEPTDSEAVARSLDGQPDAFAMLVHRHGRAVHGYLARRVGRQHADDLLGEVWLRAFRVRQGYQQHARDARPWLYGIARNIVREHARDRVGQRERLLSEPAEDPWPEADARLEAVRHRATLSAGLATLRENDREVLLLHAWEQLSPTEIASSLGIPAGTARWRLHRARSQLQQHVEQADSPVSVESVNKEA